MYHVRVQSPDICQQAGQIFFRPLSYAFGRDFEILRDVKELPPASVLNRVLVSALSILLYEIVIWAALAGIIFLSCSETYISAIDQVCESDIEITWEGHRPEIRTRQLNIRPIKAEDLSFYRVLFNNPVAMQNYRGGARDITPRFNSWLNRWNEDSFSALAIECDGQLVGHTVIGHGDFEAPDQGWSELAVVIDPRYWNADFQEGVRGARGKRKIGTEVVRAMVTYARALKEREFLVPVDVQNGQNVDGLNVHRNDLGVVDWAYVPFTQLRATVHRHNAAAQNIGATLAWQYGADRRILDAERDLYTLQLA